MRLNGPFSECIVLVPMRFLLSLFTAPLSLIWYAVAVCRSKLFDWGILPSERFDVPTICVGNLAVGGTGKTPHVEYILNILHEQGYRVAMLSRGYGRKTKGYILSDGTQTAAEIGDEPFQIQQNCPYATVAVCEKRVVGIRQLLALTPRPEVIVLDDAYQHRYVQSGFNVLLTDAARLYTHDHLLPWGRLREPASAAHRANLVVVTKCKSGQRPILPILPEQTLYYSSIKYAKNYPIDVAQPLVSVSYDGRAILLIVGIANPAPLQTFLQEQGAVLVRVVSFADHHAFTAADYDRIHHEWQHLLALCPTSVSALAVTTQKDASRFVNHLQFFQTDFKSKLYVQPISVSLTNAEAESNTFQNKILNYVSKNSRNRSMD